MVAWLCLVTTSKNCEVFNKCGINTCSIVCFIFILACVLGFCVRIVCVCVVRVLHIAVHCWIDVLTCQPHVIQAPSSYRLPLSITLGGGVQ